MSATRHAFRLAYSRFRLMRNDGLPGALVQFHANGLGFYTTAGRPGVAPLISFIGGGGRPADYQPALSANLSHEYRRLCCKHSRETGPVPLPR